MSLVRILARHCICQALKGATECGDNVHDSLIGGIQMDAAGNATLGANEKKKFIAVFTDASENKDVSNRSLIASGTTEIVFEWGISTGMAYVDTETGEEEIAVGISATDSAMEFVLDLIGRQITDALNADNFWADAWREICAGGIEKIELFRVASDDKSLRLAAHQMRITCLLMDDPLVGVEKDPVPEVLAKMAQSDDLNIKAQAAQIESILSGSIGFDWQEYQRKHGLTNDEVAALGFTFDGVDEPDDLTSAVIEVDGAEPVEVTQ